MTEGRGETPDAGHEGTESLPAKRDTQSPATGESHRRPLNPIEPPWYGPVCPVVWEGRSREAPPYPDQSPLSGSTRDCPQTKKLLSCPVSGAVSWKLFGTLPAVSQNSPGRLCSETLI